ncbi:histidine kinase [Rhodoferax sp. GW822-FHT02A01]|uniref:hybrid sensor histidine kinase/response regulator n=1 Tax=Rhodoferax sp. GW822-FHT02A01 TaxID=3141537 RepID=UPI00315D73A2
MAPLVSPTPTQPLRILHLEDSELDHQLVCRALKKDKLDFTVTRVDSLAEFDHQLRNRDFDIVLADYRLPGFTALDAWTVLKEIGSKIPFLLLSGAIGEPAAVAAIQLGISDYLPKEGLDKLTRVIASAIEVHKAKAAEARAVAELAASEKRLAHFAQHLQTAIENERASIAREIHDDIGGSLAAVRLDLSWLARHAPSTEAQDHVTAANDMLQHAIGASQRIMMNLRPAILDQGLYPAIQWLAESFQRRSGVKTSLLTNNPAINPEKHLQLTAYRTAQEALTNISKYAQCTLVKIDLSDAEGVLTLEISDNGQGISQEALDNPAAFGIRGLKERAKVVGGWLDISTRPGQGTTLILNIPLDEKTSSHDEADFL